MLGAQGLLAGRDHYRATPAMTRGLGFSMVSSEGPPHSFASYDTQGDVENEPILTRILAGIHLIASYDTKGCGVPILTQVLTGPHSVASYDT
jgi:hypothetical protein